MTDLLDRLFPRPRHAETPAGAAAPTDAAPRVILDDSLPAQGYRLRADADGVEILHADAAGLRYALDTWDQLRTVPQQQRTAVVVQDHPDIAVRGFMLDVSRDRVPTRRTLLRYLDLAARARLNHLELYIEHTFAWRDHTQVWEAASPLTADDLRWLDEECAARGIDLVPALNCLGHMERWLKHERYAHLAECPDGFTWGGDRRPPATMIPTQEAADLVLGLVEEVMACVRGTVVNIGADEPFELGLGASAGEIAERGRGEVYFEYLERLLVPLTDRGYTVGFWADIFAEHPELMGRVPDGAIPIVWQYDAPSLAAAVIDGADEQLRQHWRDIEFDVEATRHGARGRAAHLIAAGQPFWVAPGISTWQSFTGRLDNAVENLVDVARLARETGSPGYITTQWGDHGMHDPPAVAFLPLLVSGAVAWGLDANADLDLADVANRFVAQDPTGRTGHALVLAGRATAALDAPLLNASQAFTVLHRAGAIPAHSWPSPAGLDAADALLAQSDVALRGADPAAPDGEELVAETRHAVAWARLGIDVLRLRPGGLDDLDPATAQVLLARLDALRDDLRRTWSARSRPGGLDDSVARFDALRARLSVAAVPAAP